MARIFSWKINSGKYAYLAKDEVNNTYIRNKVTDKQELLRISQTVFAYSESQYASEYSNLRNEVLGKYGKDIGSNYSDFYDTGSEYSNTHLILLSGKDGENGGNSHTSQNGVISEYDYNVLSEAINSEFERFRNQSELLSSEIQEYIDNSVGSTLVDALAQINNAREELDNMRENLTQVLAQDAEVIAALSEFTGGTSDQLVSILTQTSAMQDWINNNSDALMNIVTDYNSAGQYGLIGENTNVSEGLFGKIGQCINALSGTVGTVSEQFNAASATIETIAQWVDESAGTVSQLATTMNAQAGVIETVAGYMAGDQTNQLYNRIDAQAGAMINNLSTETNDRLTTINNVLSSVSGIVETTMTSVDTISGNINTIESSMNVLSGTITQSLTMFDEVNGTAMDLREQWDKASGMLRTVSSMIVDTDQNGNILYEAWEDGQEEPTYTSLSRIEESNGDILYTNYQDVNLYENNSQYTFIPQYKVGSSSYFQQLSNAIQMGVSNSANVLATIGLSVNNDTSQIYLGADKILLDGEVIAQTLQADRADIGGVFIGAGEISSSSDTGFYKLDSAGTINATNANISGSISATSLYIDENAYFSGTVYASKGKIGAFVLDSAGTMFVENQNNEVLSMINASDYYKVSGKTTMIACGLSGITENNTMYGWECDSYDSIKLFTLIDYASTQQSQDISVAVGDEVEAWIGELDENTNEYRLIGDYSIKVKISDKTGATNEFYVSQTYNPVEIEETGNTLTSKNPDENDNEDLVLKGGGVGGIGGSESPHGHSDLSGIQFEAVQMSRCYNCGALLPNSLEQCDVCGSLNIYYTGATQTPIQVKSLCYRVGGFNYYFKRNNDITIEVSGVHPSYLSNYASTIIYDDGTLQTKLLKADNGFFGGEIDSVGTFHGELDNVNGTLNGVYISNAVLNGSLLLGLNDTISRSDSGGNPVFKLDDTQLSSTGGPQYTNYYITPFIRQYQNWKFKTVYVGSCDQYQQLYTFRFSSGDTITIPPIFTKFMINNSWKYNIIPIPKVGLSLLVMIGGARRVLPIRTYDEITQGPGTTGSHITYTYTTNPFTYEMSANGVASLNIQYGIGLPQRCPIPSIPIASTAIALICGQDKISVYRPNKQPDILQTHFGKNGVVFTYGSAASLSFIDGVTEIINGNCGLKVTNNGVFKKTGGDYVAL